MFMKTFLFKVLSHFRTVSWEGMTSVQVLVKRKGNVQSLFRACETGGNSPYHWGGTGIGRDFCCKDGMGCGRGANGEVWKQKKNYFQRDQTDPLWSSVCWIGLPSAETLEPFQPSHRAQRGQRHHQQPRLQMAQSLSRTGRKGERHWCVWLQSQRKKKKKHTCFKLHCGWEFAFALLLVFPKDAPWWV